MALKGDGPGTQEHIDRVTATALKRGAKSWRKAFAPVLALLEQAESLEQLRDTLEDEDAVAELYASMDVSEVEDLLQKVMTLADLEGPISQSGLTFRMELPEIPVMITADGRRLYRVFQNLIDNALKYALAGSRVYLSLKTEVGRAEASLRNTSREELPTGVDLTARFVRGDASRTDGGSGLGLSIASSFTEACGGDFHVETLADLFTAVVSFPLAEEP